MRGLLLATSTALACAAVAGAGRSGYLDPSFGSGGIVVTDLGRDDLVTDVVVQPDGKIVAAGWTMPSATQDAFALVRYLPDGRLDPAFGDGGKVVHEGLLVNGVALQRNGRIVVAGVGPGRSGQDIFVARYRPDGGPDRTFGGDGTVSTDFGPRRGELDWGNDVIVQRDGKIVVGGQSARPGGGRAFVLARYRPDGRLDRTFGSRGKVVTTFGGDSFALRLALQRDGKIVAIGGVTESRQATALARYNRDGSLDRSFGSRGRVRLPLASASSVAITTSGRILVGGSVLSRSGAAFALARLTPRGRLDPVFGRAGIATTEVGGDEEVTALTTGGGAVTAAGYAENQRTETSLTVVRYHMDGSLDTAFGSGGIAQLSLALPSQASAVALQPDGDIVAAGLTWEPAPGDPVRRDFLLARFVPPR